MSWSTDVHIGEMRPWPDYVQVIRGNAGDVRRYVPEHTRLDAREEYVGWLGEDYEVNLDQAQPIVRCRDCIHYKDNERHLGLGGECRMAGIGGAVFVRSVGPDGFCAWGERRETMISWERFREAELALKIAAAEKWQVTDIACPDCGEPLLKDTTVALTTHPPKSKYKCKQCGFTGTA